MGTLRTQPIKRTINGVDVETSSKVVTSESEYTPQGEFLLITTDADEVLVKLDSKINDHIIIKSLTPTRIVPDMQKIDRLYDDLIIGNGASVELCFVFNTWYVISSDGVKFD
jgi:hypothetical protein